jgi:hypothetical protein
MPVSESIIKQQLAACPQFQQWFTRKEIAYLPQLIRDGETIHALLSGFHAGTTWLIVATDQRVLFVDKGLLFGLKQIEMPLTEIQTIAHKTGLMYGEMVVTTAGGACRVEQMAKKFTNGFAETLSELLRRSRGNLKGVQQGASGDGDVVSRLERLAALLQKGVLTPEEFQREKAKILSQP